MAKDWGDGVMVGFVVLLLVVLAAVVLKLPFERVRWVLFGLLCCVVIVLLVLFGGI